MKTHKSLTVLTLALGLALSPSLFAQALAPGSSGVFRGVSQNNLNNNALTNAAYASSNAADTANYQTNTPYYDNQNSGGRPQGQNAVQAAAAEEAQRQASAQVGTAEEQGYDPAAAQQLDSWSAGSVRDLESARQKGQVQEVYARTNGVLKKQDMRLWVRSWSERLTQAGVHPEKIYFEANRLNEKEFAQWASRQVWAVEEGIVTP